MRKVIVILLFLGFAVVALTSHLAVANGQEKAESPKLSRWHGVIVRMNKDKSTMDVRRESTTKTIHYDSSTKWTTAKGTKVIDMSEFKEGSDVICLGTYENGSVELTAKQINLQRQ